MLSYYSSEKKIGKTVKNCSCLNKNRASRGHAQNEAQFFFWKQQKEIISFQELFILSKYISFG